MQLQMITSTELRKVDVLAKRIAADSAEFVDKAAAIKARVDAGAAVSPDAFDDPVQVIRSIKLLTQEQARLSEKAAFVFGKCPQLGQ